jgi:hypothetical protein
LKEKKSFTPQKNSLAFSKEKYFQPPPTNEVKVSEGRARKQINKNPARKKTFSEERVNK